MAQPASNIRIVSPTETGVCSVCEQPAELTVRDTVTPLKAGSCCSWALLFTDHMLTLHGPRNGIIHPPSILPGDGNRKS